MKDLFQSVGHIDDAHPFVAQLEEFRAARAEVDKALERERILGHPLPESIEVGAMLETPSLAFAPRVFFEEVDGAIRVSMRSKDKRVDVCKVCGLFGGGGHVMASGARVRDSLAGTVERVTAALMNEVAGAGV